MTDTKDAKGKKPAATRPASEQGQPQKPAAGSGSLAADLGRQFATNFGASLVKFALRTREAFAEEPDLKSVPVDEVIDAELLLRFAVERGEKIDSPVVRDITVLSQVRKD